MKPFTFFALTAAISLISFNLYVDEYMALNKNISKSQIEVMTETSDAIAKSDSTSMFNGVDSETFTKEQVDLNNQIQESILKYFNFFSFLLLPVYALFAYFTFGKPYNFGEHLIANAYIQGFLFILTTFFFLASVFVNPMIYGLLIPITFLYYTYTYGRWYELTLKQRLIKTLKFIGIIVIVSVVLLCISFLIGRMAKAIGFN